MPTYDYHCNKCGQDFEAMQSMKDPHFKVCPKELCRMETWGEGEVKRQMGTGAGLIFKGSGFYITDYRSENYKEGAKKDSKDSGASSTPASAPASSGGNSGGETTKPKSDPAPAAAPKTETPKPSTPAPKSAS